jgi:uncharacterized LabA/DUF88 family protein
MKRKYVLIDGENFVHKLVHSLKVQGLIKTRKNLKNFSVVDLLSFTGSNEILYYSTTLRVPKASDFYKKALVIKSWNSWWIPYLISQGITIIKAGFLRVRDGKRCQKCGAKTDILLEKGVDVRLAVDIVSFANKNSLIYILSSDTDLLPAIQRARAKNAEVIYVAFPNEVVSAIVKESSSTVVLDVKQIKKAYKAANK